MSKTIKQLSDAEKFALKQQIIALINAASNVSNLATVLGLQAMADHVDAQVINGMSAIYVDVITGPDWEINPAGRDGDKPN